MDYITTVGCTASVTPFRLEYDYALTVLVRNARKLIPRKKKYITVYHSICFKGIQIKKLFQKLFCHFDYRIFVLAVVGVAAAHAC